jgi:hypothetical protein
MRPVPWLIVSSWCRGFESDDVDGRHKPTSHHRAVVGQCSGRQARDDEGMREQPPRRLALLPMQRSSMMMSRRQCDFFDLPDLVHTVEVMRLSLAGLVLGLATAVSALSATGNKLLVIAEDATDKGKYSQFLADVESMITIHCVLSMHSYTSWLTNLLPRARLSDLTSYSQRCIISTVRTRRSSI